MGSTPDELAAEEWLAEQQREQEYEIYQDAFRREITASLEIAALSQSHQIALAFRTDLDFAKSALEKAERLLAGPKIGYQNLLLVAWIRAYRSIEWYQTEVGQAVADAMAEPFKEFIKTDKKLKAREFFRPVPLRVLRDAVLAAMFEPDLIVERIRAFLSSHGNVRHQVVHGVYVPTLQEARACLADAIEIYNLVDLQLHPEAAAPLDVPKPL